MQANISNPSTKPSKPSNGVYIFYGEDDFSLRQKIAVWKEEFIKKYSQSGVVEVSGENLTADDIAKKFEEALAPSLFSAKKLVLARNCLPVEAKVWENISADAFLVFWQKSLDKRYASNKELAKVAAVTEFGLPHGRELNAWIKKQAQILKLEIDDASIEKLAVLSGRDLFEEKKAGGRVVERKEFFDLWQIYLDLQKLASYPTAITPAVVSDLVSAKLPENVFALSDAVASGNKKLALEVLEQLMQQEGSDEKSSGIKLLGLLSEQVRSYILVSALRSQNMDQNQIAQFLGWSPGRVFITAKHSANLSLANLRKLLSRLLAADISLKTAETNPKLLLDLILIQ